MSVKRFGRGLTKVNIGHPMKWLVIIAVWITLTWEPVPGAVNYRVEASHTYGKTWSQLSYGATTKTRIPMPVNMGLILLRLTIIFDEFGKDKTSSIGWWFDPTLGSPWMVNLGVE